MQFHKLPNFNETGYDKLFPVSYEISNGKVSLGWLELK